MLKSEFYIMIIILIQISRSVFASDDVPGRVFLDQPDVNDDHQIHIIYLLAADSKDRKWDVNGKIETIIKEANKRMFIETKKNKYSNGVGKTYKFDMRKDGKLDITFIRIDKNNTELPKWPNNYILGYLWDKGFNDPKKAYFSFAEIKTGNGGEAGVGMGAVFLGSRYNTGKSPKLGEFNHITLHEILHTQGVGFPCMPRVKNAHLKGNDYHMLGHGLGLNGKIYGHDVKGCPQLRNSVFLSPTSENPYDPYKVVCLGELGNFSHKDMSYIVTDLAEKGRRKYKGSNCKWNQGRNHRALDRHRGLEVEASVLLTPHKRVKETVVSLPTLISLSPRALTDITTLLSESIKRDAKSVKKLEKIASKKPKGSGSLKFYAERADAFIKLGRTTEAIHDLKKTDVLAMPSSLVSTAKKIFLLRSLALQQLYGGDLFEGVANLQRAVELHSKGCKDKSNLKPCHQTVMSASVLSTAYSYLGNVEKAEKWLNFASKTRKQLEVYAQNPKGLGWRGSAISASKGRLAIMNGEFTNAEKFYSEAVKYIKEVPGDWSLGSYLRELADAQILMGKYREAELTIREGLSILIKERGANSPVTALALEGLARILNEQGRSKDAESLARIAKSIYEKGGTLKTSMAYAKSQETLVTTLIVQSKYQEAYTLSQDNFKDMASIPGALESPVMATTIHRAVAALMVDDLDNAKVPLDKRLKYFAKLYGDDHYLTAESLALLSIIKYRRGDLTGAELGFLKSLPIISKGINEDAYSLKSYKHRRGIILEEFFELVAKLEQNIDEVKRTKLLAESVLAVQSSYHTSVQKALLSNAARKNFNDPELAISLRETQDLDWQINGQYSIIAALAQSDLATETEEKIDESRYAISLLKNKKSLMENKLFNKYPEYRNFIKPQALPDSVIRNVIRDGEKLIISYVGNVGTYIWAIPKTGPILFLRSKMGRERLKNTIDDLRNSVDPGPINSLEDIPEFRISRAYQLYKKLLKPVLEGGLDVSKLLFVGHGPLGQLPLSLLPTERTVLSKNVDVLFKNYAEVPWLAKTHAVTIVPSITALKALRENSGKTPKKRGFVGFGDPYFSKTQALEGDKELAAQLSDKTKLRSMPVRLRNRPQTRSVESADLSLLPRLPDTRDELHSIAKSMGIDPKDSVYSGRRANEKQIKEMKLDDIGIIVFATHGLVPGDLDGLDQPALALSSPDVASVDGDGLLTMDEIIGLRFNADWVVLSACNTASAERVGSEAVSGLGRAFFYAGAKALLVSNWPVHSGATAYLTSTLFSLQAENASLGRAELLQQTRLKMINQGSFKDDLGNPIFSYAHPIFWAPFTIIGDGGV